MEPDTLTLLHVDLATLKDLHLTGLTKDNGYNALRNPYTEDIRLELLLDLPEMQY